LVRQILAGKLTIRKLSFASLVGKSAQMVATGPRWPPFRCHMICAKQAI
jgi:hypothetical protein